MYLCFDNLSASRRGPAMKSMYPASNSLPLVISLAQLLPTIPLLTFQSSNLTMLLKWFIQCFPFLDTFKPNTTKCLTGTMPWWFPHSAHSNVAIDHHCWGLVIFSYKADSSYAGSPGIPKPMLNFENYKNNKRNITTSRAEYFIFSSLCGLN